MGPTLHQILVSLMLMISSVFSAKILMIPSHHKSHVNFFALTAKVLQETGHHDVRMLVSEDHAKMAQKQGISPLSMGQIPLLMDNEAAQKDVFTGRSYALFIIMKVSEIARGFCEALLQNEALLVDLEKERFDLILVDSFDLYRCMYVIPYRLGVPYISLGARHDPWNARISALPSVEGQQGAVVIGGTSTFLERLKNTLATVMFYFLMPPSKVADPDFIVKHAPNRPPTTFQQLYHDSEMWIVNFETMCLDFPRVHGHHYLFIGGLGCEPAKPLPKDLDDFVSGAKDGVIVVTFGSALKNIPLEMMTKMLEVFRQLPQRVLMRYGGEDPGDVPRNVLLSEWLPQNDLLGHPKTKLFITHGGNNGQLEALYHGVPMLTMPVFGDQTYNGQRVAAHGYGLVLDSKSFTSEQLKQDVEEIINNPKYNENIQRCSAIFRDMPDPRETLTFWVNHILKYGGAHLKPQSLDMPLWQFFMFDILLFVLVMSGIALCCIRWCCMKITNRCSKSTSDGRNRMKTD